MEAYFYYFSGRLYGYFNSSDRLEDFYHIALRHSSDVFEERYQPTETQSRQNGRNKILKNKSYTVTCYDPQLVFL